MPCILCPSAELGATSSFPYSLSCVMVQGVCLRVWVHPWSCHAALSIMVLKAAMVPALQGKVI